MAHISPIDVQKYLESMEYPASKEEVVEYARAKDASADMLDVLDGLFCGEYFF